MLFTDSPRTAAQIGAGLPPTAPFPAALQTLACRLWPLDYFELCSARYGNRFTVHPIDMPPLVFLSDPQEIRAVLTAPPSVLHTGVGGAIVAPLFGEDSFTLLEGDEHMRVRNAILPAFSRRVAQGHARMIAEVVQQEVASWPLEETFATHPRLRTLTLRVIMRSLFGGEDSVFEKLHGQLLRMLPVMASLLLQEPRLRHLPGWRTQWKRFVHRREEVDRSISALIAQRRGACGGGGGGDLLDILLAAHDPDGSPMSDRQVRDNLVSVLIAGHETTASELAWAFQLLAHNPAVQERLIEEIDGEAGSEYLTATIHEVLRHRPVFLFAVPRAVAQPIEIGGWTYRPPTRLMACIYLLHHDPALYPDPHELRPERFLGSPPRPRIWLPWGGGRKRCLGQHLAMLEMRTVLQTILATRLVLPASERIERAGWRSVMVTPHAGSRVILRRRRQG
ncbi:MAG: cytochrome P450 [Solirubrobacteraceae bacterium]